MVGQDRQAFRDSLKVNNDGGRIENAANKQLDQKKGNSASTDSAPDKGQRELDRGIGR